MSSFSPRLLLVLVSIWVMGATAQEPAAPAKPVAPAKPSAPPSALDLAVARLRKAGKGATASKLLAAVDKAKAERQKLKRGHVVMGHLTLKGGAGRLEQLNSPVTLVEDGWFVTLAPELLRPLPLRLHGYEAVNVSLKDLPEGDVVSVGEVSLSPVPPEKLGTVRGRVVAADPKARIQAYAFISPGDENLAGGKVEADRPATRLEVKREKDGSFQLGGLTPHPARYELWFKAPGAASVNRTIYVSAGATQDLGEIRLEKPDRLRVRYVVSTTPPPFPEAQVREAIVSQGESFKADPAMQGATFSYERRPQGERLRFTLQPARLAPLGKGKLEDFRSAKLGLLKFSAVFETAFEPGQVYLLDHRGAGQWVLFEARPDTGDTK